MIITAKKLTTILASDAGLLTDSEIFPIKSCDILLKHAGEEVFNLEIATLDKSIKIVIDAKALKKMAKRIKHAIDLNIEYEADDYESLMYDWIELNPSCTKDQYEAEMRSIAKKCGV